MRHGSQSHDALSIRRCRRRRYSHDALASAASEGYKTSGTERLRSCLRNGTVDLVTALDVVEHLDDDLAGLRDTSCPAPNGHALLFVPTSCFSGRTGYVSNQGGVTGCRIAARRRKRGSRSSARLANLTFFTPILMVRKFMPSQECVPRRKTASHFISGTIFWPCPRAEAALLRHMNFRSRLRSCASHGE